MGRKDKQTPSRCWERGRSPRGMHGALPASTPELGAVGPAAISPVPSLAAPQSLRV